MVAQRAVPHDEFCEISKILTILRLKSSQEQARMAGLHAGAREPCQTLVLHRQLHVHVRIPSNRGVAFELRSAVWLTG